MEPRNKRVKPMEERSLSELPEDIIIHILSLMDSREAVTTCVLSKQWRYYWTCVHSLNFCFPYLNWPDSYHFLTQVLHHRQQLKLRKLKIRFFGPRLAEDDEWKQKLILLALDYATSHQIEEFETDFRSRFFQLQNLETLAFGFGCLKTLNLKGCSWYGRYSIYHPRLVSLHLTDYQLCHPDAVIVVKAPRLKFFDLYIASPVIVNLDDCPAIDKVNIYMSVLTTFANNSTPELAWTQLVPELPHNQIEPHLLCALREGCTHFDVRTEYDYNAITYLLSRMTRMCKLLRDMESTTVLLHVFGEVMILNCSRAEAASGSDADADLDLELDLYLFAWENNQSGLLITDVLRTIRSGQVLGFLDAVKVLEKYVSEPFRRISYPDFRTGRKKDDFIIDSSLLKILWGDEWCRRVLGCR